MKKTKAELHFKDIIIQYNLPWEADVFFLTNNHEYNKWVNQLMLDAWYKRLKLIKKDGIAEISLWFEYEWRWLYYKEDETVDQSERIRKAPILQGNI